MSDGTAYNTKQQLIDSITSRIYSNSNNEVSADDEQTAMLNIVETIYNYLETNVDHNLTINKNIDNAHNIEDISDTGLDLISNATINDVIVIRRAAGWVKESIEDLFNYYNDLPQTLTNKIISALDNTITGLDSNDISDFSSAVSSNSNVTLNTTHRTSDGSSHANVVLNTSYRNVGHVPLSYMAVNNGVATLDAGGKIPSAQLPSFMTYKGTWDPISNIPTLVDGTGDNGDVYKASQVGTYNFGSGDITFAEGDWVIYNGSIWEKSTNSDLVASVNGQQGVVLLDLEDIPETSIVKYYTSTEQTNVATLTAGVSSNADSLHTHPLKADKIVTPTSAQKLEFQIVDANGQYIGSGIYKIGTNDDFVTFMAIEGNATAIFTVNNLTLSTLSVTVGNGVKTFIGEGNYININDVLTFESTASSSITINIEPLLKFTTATSEIVFNTSNSVVFNANKIRNTYGSNTQFTKTGGGSLFLRPIFLEDNVIITTTGSVTIGESEAFRNTNTKYSYDLITDISALNSTKKTVFCVETGRSYKYVASGSAYTIDNDYVLETVDGGDTRYVSLDYTDSGIWHEWDVTNGNLRVIGSITKTGDLNIKLIETTVAATQTDTIDLIQGIASGSVYIHWFSDKIIDISGGIPALEWNIPYFNSRTVASGYTYAGSYGNVIGEGWTWRDSQPDGSYYRDDSNADPDVSQMKTISVEQLVSNGAGSKREVHFIGRIFNPVKS